MAYLGQILGGCKAEAPYTGRGECPKAEGTTSALLITGLNALYPTDTDEFISNLEAHVTSNGALRMHPVKGIVGMTVAGGEINAPDLGTYGGPVPMNLNAKNIAYQIDGGDCLYKEMSKLNKRKMRVFRVDSEGYVYGTVVVKNGVEYFAGFEVTLYTTKTAADGAASYNLSLWAYYTMNNEAEEQNMLAFEVGASNIPDGLIGIALKAGKEAGTGYVVTACDGQDITEDWSDRWSADMFVNADGETPTSVAFNESTGKLTIAPEGAYRIAPAAVLAEGDMPGFDGMPVFANISEQ